MHAQANRGRTATMRYTGTTDDTSRKPLHLLKSAECDVTLASFSADQLDLGTFFSQEVSNDAEGKLKIW